MGGLVPFLVLALLINYRKKNPWATQGKTAPPPPLPVRTLSWNHIATSPVLPSPQGTNAASNDSHGWPSRLCLGGDGRVPHRHVPAALHARFRSGGGRQEKGKGDGMANFPPFATFFSVSCAMHGVVRVALLFPVTHACMHASRPHACVVLQRLTGVHLSLSRTNALYLARTCNACMF